MPKSEPLRVNRNTVLAVRNSYLTVKRPVQNAGGDAAALAIMPAHLSCSLKIPTDLPLLRREFRADYLPPFSKGGAGGIFRRIDRHISSWTLSWGVAAFVLLVMMTFPCIGLSGTLPSLSDTQKKLERVSKDPSATREQWLEAINALVRTGVSLKRASVAHRGLYFAGKGCLSLYRISARPEDLDLAIRYLSDFHRDCRKGPYFIHTLQALKEADTLKRDLEARKQRESVPATQLLVPTGRSEPVEATCLPDRENNPEVVTQAATAQPQVSHPHAQAAPQGWKGSFRPPNPYFDTRAGDGDTESDTSPSVSRNAPVGRRDIRISRATAQESSNSPPSEQNKQLPDWNGNASSHGNPHAHGSPAVPKETPPADQVASLPPAAASDADPVSQKVKYPGKTFVVVIDPGHGGKDPGAVSIDGTLKEKDITLDVAKRFKAALEKKSLSVRVTLTREDDRSLSLHERTAIANALNADLFVSVHCNADVDASSKGIETFLLNKATSPRAMKVAARENGIPLSKMSDLEATLLDLMLSSKKTESTELAKTIHRALAQGLERSKFPVRNRGVKQAPFYVLLGAQMPAVLVECAFISSDRARRTLSSPRYLGSVAEGLAEGSALYLRGLGQEG